MRPSLGGTGAPNIFLKGLRGSFDCVSEHCEGFPQTLLGFSTDDITLTALREESKPKAELLPFPVVINDNLNNNASDLFESTMEVYKVRVDVDWDGWQLKSFRYSDFEAVSPNNQSINFNMNPSDIRAIRITCLACPSSSGNPICPENFGKDVRTDIDHIIFTLNSSLLEQ